MTRAAVVVFIETTHEGSPVDAAVLFKQALHQATGDSLSIGSRLGTVGITVHDSIEAGLALGNGYLWASLTPKAFPHSERENRENG